MSHFILGASALALPVGPLAVGVTAGAIRGALIPGGGGTLLASASGNPARCGAVALPTIAARAHIKEPLTTGELASALTQRDRPSGNGSQRHACPGGWTTTAVRVSF